MPSNQFVLAYHSERPMSQEEVGVRLAAASRHVHSLFADGVAQVQTVGGPRVGLSVWTATGDTVGWPQMVVRGDAVAAWIDFPEHDANSHPDPLSLAAEVTAAGSDVTRYGAPFACIYWNRDGLAITTDSLGLARYYEFDFGDLTVWATRPGLAHIFAGRPVQKSATAWAGMATVGWNLNGVSHLGAGQHLPGRTRITAGPDSGIHRVFGYAEWTNESRLHAPTWHTATRGITNAMSLAGYFERQPICDLSGGKDSRLLAAAALRSGVTNRVRTVRTDRGEVETAEQLVARYDGNVEHVILDAGTTRSPEQEPLEIHLSNAHRSHEGSYLPITAIGGPTFKGFAPSEVATFNGIGGESLIGGALFAGTWLAKLQGQGADGAFTRMAGMVNSPYGTSKHAKELALDAVRVRLEMGQAQGISSAYGLLNYVYNSERMPFWSHSFGSRSTLTPYYSSGLLPHVAWTYWHDSNFPEFHERMLADLVPAWRDVPFYRPVGIVKRARKFLWEIFPWAAVRNYITARADALESFDPDGIMQLVEAVDAGEASKPLEVALARFLWEASADGLVDDLNTQAARCEDEVAALITGQDYARPASTTAILGGA